MFQAILCDDNEIILEGLSSQIKWKDLGIELTATAADGNEAWELIQKNPPDLLITDIRMPYMDGLELSRRLNDEYRNVHIIIFTGFDEFDYAKEAVHLEIDEYMLKPINAVELSECLKRVKNSLDKEREEKLNVKKLNDYFQEVLPKLQSNFLIS